MQGEAAASTCGVCECSECVYMCVLNWCLVPLVHANLPAGRALGPVLVLNPSSEMLFCPSWLPCLFRQNLVLILLVFGAGFSAGCVPRTGRAVATAWSFPWGAEHQPLQSLLEWGEEIHVLSRACFELPLL